MSSSTSSSSASVPVVSFAPLSSASSFSSGASVSSSSSSSSSSYSSSSSSFSSSSSSLPSFSSPSSSLSSLSSSTSLSSISCLGITLEEPIYYAKADYIQTASGNKVCRRSVLCGSQNIHLAGRSIIHSGVILRGDLAMLRLGRHVVIGSNSVIRPPCRRSRGALTFFPASIHDHVFIGKNSILQAASIGSNVWIGENTVIGKRCILKDCCRILPGTILPADSVVPPFTLIGGVPGKFVSELPESAQFVNKEETTSYYKRFTPRLVEKNYARS